MIGGCVLQEEELVSARLRPRERPCIIVPLANEAIRVQWLVFQIPGSVCKQAFSPASLETEGQVVLNPSTNIVVGQWLDPVERTTVSVPGHVVPGQEEGCSDITTMVIDSLFCIGGHPEVQHFRHELPGTLVSHVFNGKQLVMVSIRDRAGV